MPQTEKLEKMGDVLLKIRMSMVLVLSVFHVVSVLFAFFLFSVFSVLSSSLLSPRVLHSPFAPIK